MTVEQSMASRIEIMKKACHFHGLDLIANESVHKPYPWEYLINEEHGLVWCNVFKSGSTR